MIKHVNGWEISRKLQGNCKVYVKHFSGAKTKCMKDYIKPSQRENSDHYILHVGTNDLSLDRSPELIAKSIIDLALIDNSKKIKPKHLNKGKLHLNQKGSRLLSDVFVKESSHVFT